MYKPLFLLSLPILNACQPEFKDFDSLEDYLNDEEIESTDSNNNNEDSTTPEENTELSSPVAIIDALDQVHLGELLFFDGSASYDPQGDPLSYSWSCSNGALGYDSSITLSAEAAGSIDCSLTVISQTGYAATAEASTEILSPLADWTFMVYINGDNNLEDAGLHDVNEMEVAGSTENVNIVVQLDRSRGYSSIEGDWSGARRYLIQRDNNEESISSPVLEDLGNVDSGDYQVIADFVAQAASDYPAEKYALVLWNHGWSWSALPGNNSFLKGISDDEETHNYVSIAEGDLEALLQLVEDSIGQKLEILGMDACIMQNWEIAHVAIPYANYYVASQEYEDWDGWAYDTTMLDLIEDPSMDGAALGQSIAYRFYEGGDLAQSVLDLSALPSLEAELDNVAQSIMDYNDKDTFQQAAQEAWSYDGDWGSDHDLGELLENISSQSSFSDVVEHAQNAHALLQTVVTANYAQSSASGISGLSIYSPRRRNDLDNLYFEGSWTNDSLWDDMLNSLY